MSNSKFFAIPKLSIAGFMEDPLISLSYSIPEQSLDCKINGFLYLGKINNLSNDPLDKYAIVYAIADIVEHSKVSPPSHTVYLQLFSKCQKSLYYSIVSVQNQIEQIFADIDNCCGNVNIISSGNAKIEDLTNISKDLNDKVQSFNKVSSLLNTIADSISNYNAQGPQSVDVSQLIAQQQQITDNIDYMISNKAFLQSLLTCIPDKNHIFNLVKTICLQLNELSLTGESKNINNLITYLKGGGTDLNSVLSQLKTLNQSIDNGAITGVNKIFIPIAIDIANISCSQSQSTSNTLGEFISVLNNLEQISSGQTTSSIVQSYTDNLNFLNSTIDFISTSTKSINGLKQSMDSELQAFQTLCDSDTAKINSTSSYIQDLIKRYQDLQTILPQENDIIAAIERIGIISCIAEQDKDAPVFQAYGRGYTTSSDIMQVLNFIEWNKIF